MNIRKRIAQRICPGVFMENQILIKRNIDLRQDISNTKSELKKNNRLLSSLEELMKQNYKLISVSLTKSIYNMNETVIVYSSGNRNGIDIYVKHPSKSRHYLVVYVEINEDNNSIFIANIESSEENSNKGYGSLAMEYLLKYVKDHRIRKISGIISHVDAAHYDRLEHYYNKFGFDVDFKKMRIEKTL
ncbi:GNAT family N-acetyltransferase [Paenibacillus pini]|uniref:GNAT family N-acetyltransferase n=1 Tax=Paenibacillus pini TaxID=669461 RepID=UPI0006908BB9|nr:GNAT family N-acetyltransferase [Paenibacillus pini]